MACLRWNADEAEARKDWIRNRSQLVRMIVDFLDGWFCRSWGQQAEVEGIVVDERQFPYDFGGPASCPH